MGASSVSAQLLTVGDLGLSFLTSCACLEHRSSPGQVAQLVKASSQNINVVGSMSYQGTYKNQLMNVLISGTTNQCFFLSKINFFLKFKKKRAQAQTLPADVLA